MNNLDSNKHGLEMRKAALQGKDIAALMFVMTAETSNIFDNTTLSEHFDLFDRWVQGISYKAGQIRLDGLNGILYKCLVDHGAEHATTYPSNAPTLWGRIADPKDEFPAWFPYSGVNDAWMIGDKCTHNGKKYVSVVDYNVWEPGVVGSNIWAVID